jgi:hypothetical protein
MARATARKTSRRSASTGTMDADASATTSGRATTSARGRGRGDGATTTRDAGEDEGARRRGAGAVRRTSRASFDSDVARGDEEGGTKEKFECNVCFEVAREPVVTPCGHLYCWRCINTWLSVGDNVACPVCKGEMTKDMLIPLYGFGANTARGGAKREGGGAPPLESAAGLATLLGLRSSDELSTEQASQLLLSRYLLAIGTLVIVCLLVI